MAFSVETVDRILDDKEGVCIEFGPCKDFPDILELSTHGQKNIEFYGKINLALSDEQWLMIADVIIKAVERNKQRT